MKKLFNYIVLYPISILYHSVTWIRNWFFDVNILQSTSFKIPIISVGNLTVGGTGKTPHTEYILSILRTEWKTAMLSRGYKRQTKGFVLAKEETNSTTIGDEPYQIQQKFPDIVIAVDEKRVHGVTKMLELYPDLETIVLDDAFQHRYIQAGLSILLTDFNNLFLYDNILPLGRLRESKKSCERADLIVVTKCPADIRPIEMSLLEAEFNLQPHQQLYFSTYKYDQLIPVFPHENSNFVRLTDKDQAMQILLVSGIVSPKPIVDYLKNFTDTIISMSYPDHHNFLNKDFIQIQKTFNAIESTSKIIVVTEKDAARIKSNPLFPSGLKQVVYALPIKVEILNNQAAQFIQTIKSYVIENSRNS